MDISAYVFDISIYGVLGQFVINSSTSVGPPGAQGLPGVTPIKGVDYFDGSVGFLTDASTGFGLYWNAGLLNVSTGYIDASLSARDTSLNDLYNTMSTNASVNQALESYATNASVGLAIGGIDFSSYATNASVNDALVFKTDFTYDVKQDASIALKTDKTYSVKQDASMLSYATNSSVNDALVFKTDKTYSVKQDASMLSYATNASVNTTLGAYATNSSVNLALGGYTTNASIAAAKFIKEASLGTDFTWVNGLLDVSTSAISSLSSLTDVSIVSIADAQLLQYNSASSKWKNVDTLELGAYVATFNYVDGSLATKTDQTYSAKQDASIALKTDFTYDVKQDASIALKQNIGDYIKSTSTGSSLKWTAGVLDVSIIDLVGASISYVDGSISTLNASVNTAFLTNSSLGTLTIKVNYIDASLGMTSALTYALNASYGDNDTMYATNASVNLALGAYTTNASIAAVDFVIGSSLGSYTTKIYVDGSLATLKAYDDQRWIDINRCGFVDETEVSIGYNETTYVLQLIRTGSTWSYMREGITYEFATDPSIQIGNPPASGMHYIVIDNNNGVLSTSQTPWTLLDSTLPVATVFFNAALTPTYQLSEEKHQSLIDRRLHAYLHFTEGTRYMNGGVLSGPTVGGTTNAANVFGVTQTQIADEDMFETLPALSTPDGSTLAYTCFYRTNASTWIWQDSSVPYLYGPNNRIYWDSSSLVEAANTNNRWYNWYLLFTNIYGRARYAIIPGRSIFTTLALAQAEDPRSFDMTGFPIAESVIAYQFSWEYVNTWNNQGKVRLGATPRKINVATISNVGAAAGFDHNSLAGLQGGTSAEYYHLTSAEYSGLSSYTTNASIAAVDFVIGSSLNDYTTNASVNLALGNYTTNASVNLALGNYTTNASVNLALGNYTTNASIAAVDFVIGSSLNDYTTNASANTALSNYATNASVNLAGFATTVSVSTNYMPINAKFTTLGTSYTVGASDNNNVILVDVSALTVTFPNTLSAGFQTTVVNETTGIVTLNASTLLTTDSSVVLRDRYAAASVVCKSAGVFLAFGNLK